MRKILKPLLLILLILHCVLIFGFSAQNRQQSASKSNPITHSLVGTEKSEDMTMREWNDMKNMTDYTVRKSAHIALYAILGVLAYLNARSYLKKQHGLTAILFCTLYAITDEIHQAFVPGRAGMVSDVLIDFAGIMLGIGIVCLIFKFKRRKKA